MTAAPNNQTNKEIVLSDNSSYSYSLAPYEMKNTLGHVVAILEEFTFIRKGLIYDPEIYKLYRTREGNWYEPNTANPLRDMALLRKLKSALENRVATEAV